MARGPACVGGRCVWAAQGPGTCPCPQNGLGPLTELDKCTWPRPSSGFRGRHQGLRSAEPGHFPGRLPTHWMRLCPHQGRPQSPGCPPAGTAPSAELLPGLQGGQGWAGGDGGAYLVIHATLAVTLWGQREVSQDFLAPGAQVAGMCRCPPPHLSRGLRAPQPQRSPGDQVPLLGHRATGGHTGSLCLDTGPQEGHSRVPSQRRAFTPVRGHRPLHPEGTGPESVAPQGTAV